MITGFSLSQAIRVVAELGVADALSDGPRSAEELTEGTGTLPDNLFRVLRALASVGIFEQVGDRFQLTPLAEHLRRDDPDTVWPAAMLATNEIARAWFHFPQTVTENISGFEQEFGYSIWEHFRQNPDRGAIFDSMMDAFHGHETPAMAEAYDFSGAGTVVDIAGGDGDVLARILADHPHCRGVLFDVPEVAQRTRERWQGEPLAERCDFVGGDFFQPLEVSGDLFLLRHIIHDWQDDQAVQILQNVRAAMPANGKLLVIEGVIEPGNDPFSYKFLDLTMMALFGARERSRDQYTELLGRAGFEINRIVPTSAEVSIIEALPAA
jgi:hypothetical protein